MPCISSEQVAQMRKAIRAALPEYVVSVTKQHHSSVKVYIMSGPIEPVAVNVFWYKEHLKDNPTALALVQTILDKIFAVVAPRIVREDGDYGSIPNFYYDISFGKWDRPYVQGTGVQKAITSIRNPLTR